MTAPLATSSKSPPTPALGDREVMELVRDTLDQVYALCLETLQEMGFIREVDRALAKSIMSEFIRLQLIVGDDLNTSLRAMHADLEATTDELIRDLDIAAQNSTDLPSKNPSVRVVLHRFRELVKLKLTLLLAQVDAACEDMDRFLQHRLEELRSPTDMRNFIESLSQRVAAHQSRVHQIVYSEPSGSSWGWGQTNLWKATSFPAFWKDCKGGSALLHLERRTLQPRLKRVLPNCGHLLC